VEAHGGTIEAASSGRARGARFTVHFPPERVAGAGGAHAQATRPLAEGAGT
jgi:hypothetical protein